MSPRDPARWYHANFSDVDVSKVDPRCWLVLTEALGPIYNVVSSWLPGGGIAPIPGGALRLWTNCVTPATTDGDELTALVLAGHRHGCRVQVSASVLMGERGPGDPWEAEVVRVWDAREDDSGDVLGPWLTIMVHPREHVGGPWSERTSSMRQHPSLADLAERALAFDA